MAAPAARRGVRRVQALTRTIAVTAGEPAGIGPDLCLTLGTLALPCSLVVIGNLALLAERARHGYELIKEIEQRSGGWYVPSPGMVYPALSYLEDAGYASVEAAGAKKQYTISVAGLAWLDEHRATVDAIWAQLARFGERVSRAREEARFADEVSPEGRAQLHAALDELRDALRAQRGSTPERLAKLVDIVRRAATAVREAPQE